MKKFLILFLTFIFLFSSCSASNDIVNDENLVDTNNPDSTKSNESADETNNQDSEKILDPVRISSSMEKAATVAFRDGGFTITDIDFSEDRTTAIFYVWADNYGNGTSLTLEDAKTLAHDFCKENSLPETAIIAEKGFYLSTDIGFSGGVEGIPDEEFDRLEAENHPLARVITELCERNYKSEYSVTLKDEKLHIILCDGVTFSDLSDFCRWIINEHIEYIIIE